MQKPPSEKPTAGYSHPWQYFLLVYVLSAPFWLLSLFSNTASRSLHPTLRVRSYATHPTCGQHKP